MYILFWKGVEDYVFDMDKTIVGRIGEKKIYETIQNFNSKIPEQVQTAQKNIRNKFAAQGFNPQDVVFDDLVSKKHPQFIS